MIIYNNKGRYLRVCLQLSEEMNYCIMIRQEKKKNPIGLKYKYLATLF